ncbi:glycosyltransferase family 25 protein [Methylomagnum ishizawai]|uniref:glycosyltransferase family 25 protein n=1 Tax=Methylomagnum ishizawai TaxID=1760988 RepID=UPI001C32D397|nr:glycosyltransferase family 25 protein [Methylomagnum ishizawai]BBL77332.1 hypothetical protein MishRS11D_44300 [Methylomagnum ishizawai]
MKAYIITLSGNPSSAAAARNCHASALAQGYDVAYFEASTGTTGRAVLQEEGIRPITATGGGTASLRRHQREWLEQPGTLGCYASHFRLWRRSVELGEPIVVFEHDALALAPFPAIGWRDVLHMECEGNLTRLGADWARNDRMETGHGIYRLGFSPSELPELVCMPCCHAYAIQPHAAAALIEDARRQGWFAVDRAMREPVVMIETHSPSLATFQKEYMNVSSTASWRWKSRHWLGNAIARAKRRVGWPVP